MERTRYFVRVGEREVEYRTPEARYAAYARLVERGARDAEAFDLTRRYGREDYSAVTILLPEPVRCADCGRDACACPSPVEPRGWWEG